MTFSASTYANFVSRASIAHERLFLLRRSSMFPGLPGHAKALVGRGLTDHPTSNEITTYVTAIDNVPIPKSSHAKIIFYSRGLRDGGRIRFPFNVEMNINHEYWHLRDNDPDGNAPGFSTNTPTGPSRVDIKFSCEASACGGLRGQRDGTAPTAAGRRTGPGRPAGAGTIGDTARTWINV